MIAEGDGDERREVINHVAALYRRAHPVGIANIPGKDLDLVENLFGQAVQPAPGVEGVVIGKRFYLRAAFDQLLGQVGPDKAVGAGYQYFSAHCSTVLSIKIQI